MKVRARFAPAPTGFLHVGSARTALFNWLFARSAGGTLVLRIEDTDLARSTDDSVETIKRGLHWLGIDWDEGPVFQSARLDRYRDAVGQLVGNGQAYWCTCTADEVARRTNGTGYDGFCRDREHPEAPGLPLRFRVPAGETIVHDVVRGEVRFAHEVLEDFIIVRSHDGRPGFYVANAVDDIDMGITHVIRGEDLLSSTPRVLLLRQALGAADQPVYAHLPLIVDQQRRKLSKREHSVAIEEYRDEGYLAPALRNYLALLGWSPRSGREVVPIDEMVAEFRLEDVKPSPAIFDLAKLAAMNADYIRALPVETFVRDALPWLESEPPWPQENFDLGAFTRMAPTVQERVRTLSEVPGVVDFLFVDEPALDATSWEQSVAKFPQAGAILAEAGAEYAVCEWEASVLHSVTREIGERHALKLAKAQGPVRVAVTGRSVGPPLFESLEVLGRDRTVRRVQAARERLER